VSGKDARCFAVAPLADRLSYFVTTILFYQLVVVELVLVDVDVELDVDVDVLVDVDELVDVELVVLELVDVDVVLVVAKASSRYLQAASAPDVAV